MATNHPLHKPSKEILSMTLYEELHSFLKELDTELPPHHTQHFANKASDGSATLRLRDFLTGQYLTWTFFYPTGNNICLFLFSAIDLGQYFLALSGP